MSDQPVVLTVWYIIGTVRLHMCRFKVELLLFLSILFRFGMFFFIRYFDQTLYRVTSSGEIWQGIQFYQFGQS